jgi:hypothetical protein
MRATCWVIPRTIWNRLADHPANSRLARPGAGGLDETAALPRTSPGSSIKGGTSQGHRSRAISPTGGCRGFTRQRVRAVTARGRSALALSNPGANAAPSNKMIHATRRSGAVFSPATAPLGGQPCHRRRPWDDLLLALCVSGGRAPKGCPTNLLNSEVAEKQIS